MILLRKWLAKLDSSELSAPHLYITDIIEFGKLKPYQNKNLLHQKYVVEKLSIGCISEQFFCSRAAVRGGLEKFGIPFRNKANCKDRVEHLMFGKKLEKGKVVDDIVEMQVVKVILGFREKGMSLRQIYKFLTSTGVITKRGKSKWHPTMVNRVIAHYNRKG